MLTWWQKWTRQPVPDRWCVIDAETGGLDSSQDEMISLAGVAVRLQDQELHLYPYDSIEVSLRPQHLTSHDNILVHGIGRGEQRLGQDPVQALQQFLDWVKDAPLIGFHSAFDRAFIEKTALRHGLKLPRIEWLDLAELAPAVCSQPNLRSLDDWLQHFEIPVEQRHSAAADAYATALLLLRVGQAARHQGELGFYSLRHAARSARHLGLLR
jgi:DNA polymerase-3 subunit epsilon